jgi:hypothetical protein
MPTEGTEKVLGGTPAKRYPDPLVTNTPNANGLYPWSAFRAPLVIIDSAAGTIEAQENLDGAYTEFLLFTSDLPAICWLVAETTGSAPYVQFFNYVENNTIFQRLLQEPSASPLAAASNIGQVLQGYLSNTDRVRCTGFAARVQNFVSTPYGAAEGATTKYYLTCIANAATVSSPISFSQPFQPQGTLSAPEPVICRVGDYTQAMKDAGNTFVDSSGGVCLIVGLWDQPFL